MPADVAALAMLGWHRLLICPAQSFIHSFHLTIYSFDKSSLGLYSAGCRSQHWEHKTDLSSHPELPRCEEDTCRGRDWTGPLGAPASTTVPGAEQVLREEPAAEGEPGVASTAGQLSGTVVRWVTSPVLSKASHVPG